MPFALSADDLGRFFPFYVMLDPDGVIVSVGPVLHKIAKTSLMLGQPVFDGLDVIKPRNLNRKSALRDALHMRLKVEVPAAEG